MKQRARKKQRFSDEDQLVVLVSESSDIAYLVAAGVEQHDDSAARSIPVEVGPRRVVGLRMSMDDLLDLSETLHKLACPTCSKERVAFERRRAIDSKIAALRSAIDVCRKYAEEHPEYDEAAAQIAVRIAKLGRLRPRLPSP